MKIQDLKWKQTKISNALYLFPGELGQILQETNPRSIVRAEKFLSYIVWRWYFLVRPIETERFTPYIMLNVYRIKENWPKNGQFLPSSKISIKDKRLQIDITVDYISFDEQPFLQDLKNFQAGKPFSFTFDKDYQESIEKLAKHRQRNNFSNREIPMLYLEQNLMEWYIETKFLK